MDEEAASSVVVVLQLVVVPWWLRFSFKRLSELFLKCVVNDTELLLLLQLFWDDLFVLRPDRNLFIGMGRRSPDEPPKGLPVLEADDDDEDVLRQGS